MFITLEKKEFANAVHSAARFAERGSATLPALSAIVIVAGNDGIKLRATNLETGIDLAVKGDKKSDGVVAIPARTLEQISSALSGEGVVTLEHSGDTVLLTAGGAKSTIKTVPYEDFPTIPMPEAGAKNFVLSGAVAKHILTSMASCASSSSIRPELASVYLAIEGGTLTAVATDSFRLAEKKIPLSGKATPMHILIPAKNANDIAQALPDTEITIIFDDHQCCFVWDGGRAVTRLTSASFPDYRQIIPKEFVAEATVLRQDFERGLKRASVFSDTFQKVRMNFDPKKKTVTLSARNNEVGETIEPLSAKVDGEAVELSFNHRYLCNALPFTSAESITLSSSGIGRPLIIRGVGDNSLLYLVSPMNQ